MKLDDILKAAEAESVERQRKMSLAVVKRKAEKKGETYGFLRSLRKRPFSVIAELKARSPSMGDIGKDITLEDACGTYAEHPVVGAISVLTQAKYFGGSMEILQKVRQYTQGQTKPILRKDFIWTEYEVYYSRMIGADAILLMANVVTDKAEFRRLHDLAVSIGLDVLCEVHDEEETALIPPTAQLCGINARRFKDVHVNRGKWSPTRALNWLKGDNRDTHTDLGVFKYFNRLPATCVRVAESGISADNVGLILKQYAFEAALIGTSLLKAGRFEMRDQLDKIQKVADEAFEIHSGVHSQDVAYAG